jgi:dCMP deaminase
MSLSVGIRRIVVLSDYAEDGTQLLNAGTIKLVKLDPVLLKPWTSSIYQEAQNHVLKQ